MTLLIAICQIFVLDGDREGNFARIENALAEARALGAEIACFPEMSLFGWVNPEAHERAFPIPGPDSERLAALARKYHIGICAGLAEKEGENLYDSAVLIGPDGNLLLKHRKVNLLSELMDPPYTPGEGVAAADTPWGRVGLMICADTFRDGLLDHMAGLKPDIVLVPYGWAAEEGQWPEHGKELSATVSRAAKRIGAPVVGTDCVGMISNGPWRGRTYGGQSVCAGPDGKAITILRDRDRDVRLVEVALDRRL